MHEIKSICVYCGSQSGNSPNFDAEARVLGKSLAEKNIALVYGGGDRGIMGAVSESCRTNGGQVIGIIPEFLVGFDGERNLGHDDDTIIVTKNMHERKQKMFENADAFIALLGGVGTVEEIIEILTWAQLGRHTKPTAFLNTDGFWQPMLQLFDHMKSFGFLHNADRMNPVVIDHAKDVIETLRTA